MKLFLTKNLKRISLFGALIALSGLLLFLLNKQLITVYFLNKFVGGWDGSGHYAIGKLYADNIFPSFWGWIPNWYSGMPFPQFYPPIFYFINALVYKISGLEFDLVFKSIVLFSATVIPVLLSILYFKNVKKSKIQASFVFLVSIILMTAKSKIGYIGISIPSLLNNGLVTQPMAFIFSLLWLIFFLEIDKNVANKYVSGFFLTLIFLTNVHVAIITFFLFGLIFVFKLIENRKQFANKKIFFKFFFLYFLSGLIPLIVASFWYLPMIYYYDYFAGRSLNWKWGSVMDFYKQHYYFPIFITFAAIFGLIRKNVIIIALSITAIVSNLFLVIKIWKFLPFLPVHVDRWIGTLYFFLPIFIVFALVEFRLIIKCKLIYYFLIIILVLYSAHTLIINNVFKEDFRGIYTEKVTEEIQPVIDYFKDKDGMILVEWFTPYEKPTTGVLDAYLGIQGNSTVYSIIRESALSSIFWVPMRNSLSGWPECWGIKCSLALDPELLNGSVIDHIKTVNYFGVQYLVQRSANKKEIIEKTGLITKEKDFIDWVIYKINNEAKLISEPQKEPILVFSDLNIKDETETNFDFVSLVEEINIKKARTDFTFVYADEKYIDLNNDLDKFKYILIDSYNYKDSDNLKNILSNYLEKSKIIAVSKDNEIFNFLETNTDNKENILLFENNINMDEMIVKLDNFVEDYISNDEKIKPMIIKQSYFPTWKSSNGEKIFMTGPGQILIFSNQSPNLFFDTPKIVVISHLISIIGLILTSIVLIREYIYFKKKK
jgi:uncharacterized membrane protein